MDNEQGNLTHIALKESLLLRLSGAIFWGHLNVLEIGGPSADGLEWNPLNRNTVAKLDSRLEIHRVFDLCTFHSQSALLNDKL